MSPSESNIANTISEYLKEGDMYLARDAYSKTVRSHSAAFRLANKMDETDNLFNDVRLTCLLKLGFTSLQDRGNESDADIAFMYSSTALKQSPDAAQAHRLHGLVHDRRGYLEDAVSKMQIHPILSLFAEIAGNTEDLYAACSGSGSVYGTLYHLG